MRGMVDMGTDHEQEVELDEHGNIINPDIHILTDEEAAEIEASLEEDEITKNVNRFWRRYGRQLWGFKPSSHRLSDTYKTRVPLEDRPSSDVGNLATKTPPWLARQKRRARNKVAKQARRRNRGAYSGR